MKTLFDFISEKLIIGKSIVQDIERKPTDAYNFEIGDIIVSKYQYGMILIDFYKIIGRPSGKTFEVAKIPYKIVSGDGMQGTCVPDIENFDEKKAERLKLRIKKDGCLRIDNYHSACKLWDETPQYFDHLD